MSSTSKFFEASDTKKGKTNKFENLTPRWMREYLLGTHGIENNTYVTTLDLKR